MWLPAIQEIDQVCRSLPDTEQDLHRELLGRLTAAMTPSGQPRPAPSRTVERDTGSVGGQQ